MRRTNDLSQPAQGRRNLSVHYDPDAFGRFSEAIARNLGTARFLVIQTAIVIVWISINILAVEQRWDPYPFILLNLAFSTQAAYAAPLILLAQNRQDERDRAQTAEDRRVAARMNADTDFLAREIASLRIALSDIATQSDIREISDALNETLDSLRVHGEPTTEPADSA